MSINTVISYPIPPYSNVPIEPQFYQPRRFVITAISLGQTTTITTSVDHDYVIGQEIRLLFPTKYGCSALNEQSGMVISIPASDQIEVNINSMNVDPFIPNPTFLPFQSQTPPQIVAIGDFNSGNINASGRQILFTNIPGSFENISPA